MTAAIVASCVIRQRVERADSENPGARRMRLSRHTAERSFVPDAPGQNRQADQPNGLDAAASLSVADADGPQTPRN